MPTTKINSTDPFLIAPCGINCRLCRAYARDKNGCPGCRGEDAQKSVSCLRCKIKNCERLVTGKFQFCFECDQFPCALVAHLDKRYRTRYGLSVIDNLVNIENLGMDWFVKNENQKWACPSCGELVSMHLPHCLACGVECPKLA